MTQTHCRWTCELRPNRHPTQALYPALHKLEAEGLLDVEVATVDNRLRKYYKLTEHGTKETVNRLAELEDFIATMKTIVNPKLA